MAKSKKVVEDLAEETPAEVVTEVTETVTEETPAEEPASESKPQEMPAWLVKVDCPTPLANNPKTVRAFDEAGAWSAFCAMNGITGTDHPKTITRI